MKKSTKVVLKSAGALVGVTLGLCEGLYEGILNRRLIHFISSHKIFHDKESDKYYETLPETVAGFNWYDDIKPVPTAVFAGENEVNYSYIVRQEKPSNLWAICIHGYSALPKDMANIGKHYYEQGYNILFPCMRAHSLDQHKYCSMGYYDKYIITSWIKYITDENPDSEIILHGISMGSATTMLVTGEDIPANVKCAVADCGYTTCWDEYESQIGEILHLPVFPFLHIVNRISIARGNFDFRKSDPINAVARSHTPTLFIHGEEDTFVPYSMLDRLYNACSAEKDKLSVPDAIHAVSSVVHPEIYWEKIDSFKVKYMNEKAVAEK